MMIRQSPLVPSAHPLLTLLLAGAAGLVAVAAGGVAPPPDAAPVAQFETSAMWAGEDSAARITVTLSEPAATEVQIPFQVAGTATPGKDFGIEANPIRIPAGATRADITIKVRKDKLDEADETVLLTLQSPTGAVLAGHTTFTLGLGESGLGGPLDGLTDDELGAFERGKLLFQKRFSQNEGLGPFYNAVSCASCHSKPVTGGSAALYRNFYLGVYQFGPTPISQSTSIPPFISQVVPAYGSGPSDALFTLEGGRPLIPETVLGFPVISAQRNSIPIFGLGLFEFVNNAEIASRADPDDLNGDGISGRINTALGGTAVGRFGLKAQSNNIELFTRAPLMNQMGITTMPLLGEGGIVSLPMAPFQASGNPNEPTVDQDGVPDPEMDSQDLGDLIAFTKFLAPPKPKPFSADALAGEAIFNAIGCTSCHVPTIESSKGPVHAYTDLLIHDMGPVLADNMKFGEAPTAFSDFRTQPLWGVSEVGPYMHDGRAPTLLDAVLLHDGEAAASRATFDGLPLILKHQVIVFLEHL